jgi:hypothetical protein
MAPSLPTLLGYTTGENVLIAHRLCHQSANNLIYLIKKKIISWFCCNDFKWRHVHRHIGEEDVIITYLLCHLKGNKI